MNLQEALENEHSKTLTQAIVKYVGNDKVRFKELLALFMKGDYRLAQRAGWPLSYVCIAEPALVKPYYGQLLQKLNEPGHHPAIQRNILRMLQETDIPEKYQGPLVDSCFRFIKSETHPPAIRAFAITCAANICRHYAELRQELLITLGELNQYPQPPAIMSRIKLALKELRAA